MGKINWPENLIEELAYRRTILFLGSGVSATAKNEEGKSPETWGRFLENIKALINNPTQEDIKFIDEMLAQENYLLALQAIYDLSDSGAYSKYLKDNFSRGKFNPSPVHKAIKEIESKIVITTNFDKIYDNLCNDDSYVRYDYQRTKSIISNIKSPENIIIKAHGTIDDTDEIIFTSKQYYKNQEKYPEFYSLLKSLFLTHTVLFLGYSLNDPDINLVLQSIRNTSSPASPHYIVIKEGISKHIIKHWEHTYNVRCLEYGPSYDNFEENIEELKDLVIGMREDRQIP
ncbi:SIR2 family protein [Priestia megaterium]|uniref:SIR2 family protein n=1 Tax=Priestia megaterium TaxID=1404 RepID=UPI0035CA3BB2